MAHIEIDNIMFEEINPSTKKARQLINAIKWYWSYYGQRDLVDAYKRPSQTKIDIYNDWSKFFIKRGILQFGVLGANSCTFSIGAIDEKEGDFYYITKTHNYIIKGGFII